MTTPPRVTAEQVQTAMVSIINRHTQHDDAHLEELEVSPAGVLDYLRRRAASFPTGLRLDDLDDVAVLMATQWWMERDRERWWFQQVVRLGGDRMAFAAAFGIGSRQGFRDRLDRLAALFGAAGRRDEQFSRELRAEARRVDEDRLVETMWLVGARTRVDGLWSRVLQVEPLADDETASAVRDVQRAVAAARGEWSPASLTELGLAIDAVSSWAQSQGPAWTAAAAGLTADFAELQAQRRQVVRHARRTRLVAADRPQR